VSDGGDLEGICEDLKMEPGFNHNTSQKVDKQEGRKSHLSEFGEAGSMPRVE